ncbi:MAG: thiopurine S-methyltransferase [Xanthomonadales bacterium]|nr:thiopurine S-methyltransferase [Gammaproteobacteria bacterium]MBT8051023.1 thiopurine S-methyltransferase [Gammaproteobacteria bacterium]NNJ78213.1 thiopurine S-methyltransferase [Xanthomonadales bacterium]NNL05117.1 thiopurine S-methyltransferase [Xanthomonadales bacterium]
MESEFWHECWEQGRLGFHQEDYNRHMVRFFPGLNLAHGAHVLVPLCGKSRDMLWLREQGYRVTGIELSERAVGDFFEENALDAGIREIDGGTAWKTGTLEILCCDLFETGLDVLDPVDAVYDRAALPALPGYMRREYATLMTQHLPLNTITLLLAMEYPQQQMEGPPFSVSPAEIEMLFGLDHEIDVLRSEACLDTHARWKDRGLTRLVENVYRLQKIRNPSP